MHRKPRFPLALLLGGVLIASPVQATSDPTQPVTPNPWTRVLDGDPPGYPTWVRREADGHISCFSLDGVHCQRDVSNPNTPEWASLAKPLYCGQARLLPGPWGITGYNDERKNHWCRTADAVLRDPSTWMDYTALGHTKLLAETPDGDLMCFSTDDTTCSQIRDGKPVDADGAAIDYASARPLVCGAHYRKMHLDTGYDTNKHWCNLPRIVKRETGKIVQPDERLIVDIPYWTSEEQPAVILKTDLAPKGSLRVALSAVYFDARHDDYADKPGNWGLRIADRKFSATLGSQEFKTTWWLPGDRSPVLALSVTRYGRMCFFAGSVRGNDPRFIFSPSRALESFEDTLKHHNQPPFRIDYAPSNAPNVKERVMGKPQVEIEVPSGRPAVEVKELLVLKAPRVRHDNGAGDDLRWITYPENCRDHGRYYY